jgi:hypothetical protein
MGRRWRGAPLEGKSRFNPGRQARLKPELPIAHLLDEPTASGSKHDNVVAMRCGRSSDLVWGLHALPQLFPDKVIEMNDVADALGKTVKAL